MNVPAVLERCTDELYAKDKPPESFTMTGAELRQLKEYLRWYDISHDRIPTTTIEPMLYGIPVIIKEPT